jgi:hypothetical protein
MRSDRPLVAVFVVLSLAVSLSVGLVWAQKIPGLGRVKQKLEKFSLNHLLEGEPPVSTSLADAVTEVPFLDDFNPPEPGPMTVLPRAKNGDFMLVRTGVFKFAAASYCLKAGTYAPSKGAGYLYAPLKGARAEIVRHILENSVLRRDVPQKDIQSLLWAIIARTKFTKMGRPMQLVASKLLTPREIAGLSGASLDAVPDAVLDKAMDDAGLPGPVREVLRAESRIRSLMTRADASYEDVERVAVLTGTPLPGEGSRGVPWGRWSFHPDGYFIRYFPYGYSRTDIEISVPRPFKLERDAAGRIMSLSDDNGSRIVFEYTPAAAVRPVSGGSLKAQSLKAVRFSGVHPWHLDQKVEGSWTGAGWTLAGFAGGAAVPKGAEQAFPNAQARVDKVRDVQGNLAHLSKVSKDPSGFMLPDRESLCLEIASLCDGVNEAIVAGGGALDARPGNDAYAFVKMAWQAALVGMAGDPAATQGSAGFPGTAEMFSRPGHGPWFGNIPGEASQAGSGGAGEGGSGASFGAGMPGNTNSQRLGESARPADPCQAVINVGKGEFKINGESVSSRTMSASDLEGASISTGKKGRVEIVLPDDSVIRLGSNSTLTLPQNICQQAQANREARANLQILMDAGFIYSRPAPRENFEIKTSNAVDGVRGDLRRFVHGPGDRIFLASRGEPPQEALTEAAIEAVYNEMKPGEAELAVSEHAYFVACERDVYYYARVDRGTVEVGDSKGAIVTLKAGEHLLMRLAPAPTPSDKKDMFTRTAKGK